MDEIVISIDHLDLIKAHASESFPREACGIMAGRANIVKRIYKMKNADESTLKYRFDPGEQFKVMKEIEAAGLRMVAIYHSHPCSAAFPSVVDIKRAFFPGTKEENFPGVAHVIVGYAGSAPEVSAFLINGDGVKKLGIKDKTL